MKIFLISIISILVITLFVVGGFFFFAKKEDIYTDKNFIANVNGEFIHLEDFRKKLNLVVKITKIPYNNKQFDKKILLFLMLNDFERLSFNSGKSFFFFCLKRNLIIW